ncbi:hypothetical protein PHMEG_00014581 [Phytophthora megakarya]|uniref:Uncharacterized protein n=1 Tax=Phytophthora megakarya TaxID=4795 RepID=A0A225W3Z8_9STRA|nr:hypothetical protein PHMEG_00014581 [Phytophthora megakarya]
MRLMASHHWNNSGRLNRRNLVMRSFKQPLLGRNSMLSRRMLKKKILVMIMEQVKKITSTCVSRKLLKRWKYVHTNAMGIAFLLDPTTNLDDFVGSDDDTVEDQISKVAELCGVITSRNGTPKLTAEILAFKSSKRLGGKTLRLKNSESSPQDYWNAMKQQKISVAEENC